MASIVKRVVSENLASPPKWLSNNLMFEVIMGSYAYGVSSDASDIDIYGFTIPPKDMVFPHLAGHIPGFGNSPKNFENWQEHHIIDKSARKQYDISIYSIIKYFNLCMGNNPNMIDSLFVPYECITHSTNISNMIRDKRHMFLHKGCYHKFKGYAYSQLHKAEIKIPKEGSKRQKNIEVHGFDLKFCYHVVRLLLECEQILLEGDLDLRKNREYLKAIRRGESSFEDIKKWFSDKESYLEKIYHESSLRHSPDEKQIKQLLLDCLEEHYGSLSNVVENPDKASVVLEKIKQLIDEN